ncbi:TetR family transcriptional regulator [Microbacterium kyungheense]|uniref:TetR family transcriptional regulator n=1 Tax=Microbacterium kyungheense TaxID=1263636 RepID=A0A543EAC6_9MICO|nr:TetR family transcriptional regulator [Microbacterium kyungheense]TQM18557.1 TetR family transcriptional regulator [Microbacterium kyungheense]
MADRDATAPRRRRGRPRGGRTEAREQILAAAATEFGDRGYDGATIRTIAERAGVDSALVHHYFGTKADLFAAAIDIPINPASAIPEVIGTDLDTAGERLVRFVLELWDRPAFRDRGVAMLRSVIGNRRTASLMVGFVSRELIRHIGERIAPGDEGRTRASLVASQVVGLMVTRYVLELEPIASTPVDDLVAAMGPNLQRYLTGPLTPAASA